MIRHYRQGLQLAQMLGDLTTVAVCFLVSWWIRFRTPLVPLFDPDPGFTPYRFLLWLVLAVWALLLQVGRVGRLRGGRGGAADLRGLLQAHALGLLVLLGLTFFIRQYSYSRIMMVIFACISTLGLLAQRRAARRLLQLLSSRGFGLRRVLLVGSGPQARQVVQRIQWHPELGFRFLGIVTGDPALVGRRVRRVPVLGTYEEAASLARQREADLVVLALPTEDQSRFRGILNEMGDLLADIWVVPDFVHDVRLPGRVAELEGLPLIALQATPLSGWNVAMKRAVDLGLAGLLLLVLAPALALIALVIRLSSGSPVLFRQERMGLDGHRFQILKFRTMVRDAEARGARFASPRDPRITPAGRLLRKASLDELPQLWNVLRGEMSLVGPRPERPVFIEELRRHLPRYMLRHRVKAGMTGFAQVHGLRGATSFQKRLQHDLFYIENWSVWLDLKILWLTIPAVLRGRGAV